MWTLFYDLTHLFEELSLGVPVASDRWNTGKFGYERLAIVPLY